MGIQGLLPMLKEIQEHGHVDRFKGMRLAVDAYVWLHKGAFGCAESLVKGERNSKLVDYAMHRVRMLRHHGIEPYIVFDGGPLPAKKVTEVSRAQSRAAHLARAQSLEAQGRKTEARDAYTKCLDITPELAYQLIKALRLESVQYVVAPYEADAQLCYLEREGHVDGIITEDSDLLVFGCKQVIFKMDGHGQCVWINRSKFGAVSSFPMHGWTDSDFRRMAMLSGCDYLPSVQGMGIKTAHRMLRRCKTVDKVLYTLKMEGAMDIPPTYIDQFNQAELAFRYQRVYCPMRQRIVTLNELPEAGLSEEDQRWIGLDLDPETAQGLARGDIHPETRKPIEDPWPQYTPACLRSATKVVLGESSKGNAVGPMDAFIKRSKLPKELHITPVGVIGSGRSSMHDEMILSAPAGPNRRRGDTSAVIVSKHFGKKGLTERQELELAITKTKEEMEWKEESDEDGPDVEFSQTPINKRAKRERPSSPPDISLTPIKTRFSSPPSPAIPIISSQRPLSSPPRRQSQAVHVMSPSSDQGFSTPPESLASSPTDSYTADPFSPSPRPKRHHAVPHSPDRPRQPTDVEDEMVPETQEWNYAAPILIPTSSPALRTASSGSRHAKSEMDRVQGSSDSFEEEDIRTPSAATSRKRKVKQEVKEVVDPADEAAGQKAEVIGMGWRAKYSFGAASPFPAPRSTRISKILLTLPVGHPESPVVQTPGSVLRARPSNFNTSFHSPLSAKRSPTKAQVKAEPEAISTIECPVAVQAPETVNRQYVSSHATSILERFRYTGVRL